MIPNEFLLGFAGGVLTTMGITYLVGWSYSRITRLPSPSGRTYQEPVVSALPMVLTNDAKEAANERQFLQPYNDAPEGLGR